MRISFRLDSEMGSCYCKPTKLLIRAEIGTFGEILAFLFWHSIHEPFKMFNGARNFYNFIQFQSVHH